jgi:hypothetical protein
MVNDGIPGGNEGKVCAPAGATDIPTRIATIVATDKTTIGVVDIGIWLNTAIIKGCFIQKIIL